MRSLPNGPHSAASRCEAATRLQPRHWAATPLVPNGEAAILLHWAATPLVPNGEAAIAAQWRGCNRVAVSQMGSDPIRLRDEWLSSQRVPPKIPRSFREEDLEIFGFCWYSRIDPIVVQIFSLYCFQKIF